MFGGYSMGNVVWNTLSCLSGHEDTPEKLSYSEHSHHFIYFYVICEYRICVGALEQKGE